jgi:hypothetical protein
MLTNLSAQLGVRMVCTSHMSLDIAWYMYNKVCLFKNLGYMLHEINLIQDIYGSKFKCCYKKGK